MTTTLTPDIIALLDDDTTRKVLATVDADDVPHVVEKRSLHHGGDGTIHYLELLETSTTNRNLVRSIWFGGKVAISLSGGDGRSVQIKGRPVKIHITGPLYLRHYERIRALLGDVDLAGVWVIEPDQVIDQSFAARKSREETLHPDFIHLDRLAIQEDVLP
jgi:hypothetical protein